MLPSTRQLFTFLLFAAIFVMAAREITDPDFWWHLRTGQYILESGTIPHSDIFSFTAQAKEWVAHEWLSEIIIYALFRAGGFPLLIISFALIITGGFVLAYLLCEGRPFIAGFVVLLSALASAPTWGVRPQSFSFLLTALFIYFLEDFRMKGDWRRIAALVPLMVLWVNLHSGFALGIVVAGVYLFVMTLEHLRGGDGGSRRQVLSVATVFALILGCVVLNPNGARMYTYPFETLTSAAMQKYIQEWFSPDFHLAEFQPFAILLIALVGGTAWGRARLSLPYVLLSLIFGYAALRSARNIPMFALVAAPILAREIAGGLRGRAGHGQDAAPGDVRRNLGFLNLALMLVILATAGARLVSVAGNQTTVESSHFPAAAVSLIQSQRPPPNIYNSYGWGGYLIWKLYPDYRVYIDGRADVYGDTFIEDYLRIYRAEPGWSEELDNRGVRTALIEPGSPIAIALSESPAWHRVFVDSQSALFERN